jgi:CheY-like chemotaxis protein
VFERFRQARGLATSRDRGLGLGLAIVHYLVERHHGDISVESEGLGRGTTCAITLPLLDEQEAIKVATQQMPLSSLEGLHILVVEDDPDALDALQLILARYGATVIGADSATLGEAQASERAFDVLVSDVGLPDATGGELLRRLRARGHAMPAIAVTAFATAEDRRRLLAEGFQTHVAKPVDPDRLIRAVVHAAEHRKR